MTNENTKNSYNKEIDVTEFDVNYPGDGIKVRIFDLNKGLVEYEHIKIIRILSKDYNLLIMQDYLPIIGEIEGDIDIKNEELNLTYNNIEAFYVNSNNVFNLMIREIHE
ncbi:MAG: hypothetical protein IJO57_01435 [Bacilli bacterium]|nr:hypothetical protein [Bacilli bacterium]